MNYYSFTSTKWSRDIKNITLIQLLEVAIIFYVFAIFFSVSSGTFLVMIARLFIVGVWFLLVLVKAIKIKKSFYYLWGGCFLLYHLFLILLSENLVDKDTSIDFLLTTAYTLIVNFVILSYLLNNKKFIYLLIKVIPLFAAISLFWLYLQYGFNYYLGSRGEEINANLPGFKGTIGTILALFILVFSHQRGKLTKQDVYFGALAIINLILTILTASRTSFIIMGITIVLYVFLMSRDIFRLVRNLLIAFAILCVVYLLLINVEFLYDLLGNRLEDLVNGLSGNETDASTSTRMQLIEWGMEFFYMNPLFGCGLDGFRSSMYIYHPKFTAYYAHNNFVEMLVAGGVFGFAIYYSLFLVILVKGIRRLKSKNKLIILFLSLVVAILICDYGKVTYYDTVNQLIVLLAFYIVGMYGVNKNFNIHLG